MITDLRGQSYREKRLALGHSSLGERRNRADLVCLFKILKGIEKIDGEAFFNLFQASRITRGNSIKVALPRFKVDVRRYSFFLLKLSVSGVHFLTMQSVAELLQL